jgi:predicted transcriptional regulator
MISPKQQAIINILQTRVSMTAAEIAFGVGSEVKATSKHLRLLEDTGHIYVCEWRKGKYGVPTKAYTLGQGESVELVSSRKKKEKKTAPAPVVDVPKPIVPRADYASAWLFNEPKVELLGAKYDLLQT